MTKTRKSFLIIILAFAAFFCALFAFYPIQKTNADDDTNIYGFTNGAALSMSDKFKLKFDVELIDPNFENLKQYANLSGGSLASLTFGTYSNTFNYNFSVYRAGDNNDVLLTQKTVVSEIGRDKTFRTTFTTNNKIFHDNEIIEIHWENSALCGFFGDTVSIVINTDSPFQNYYVKMDYFFSKYVGVDLLMSSQYRTFLTGTCSSSVRSYSGVVNAMIDAGALHIDDSDVTDGINNYYEDNFTAQAWDGIVSVAGVTPSSNVIVNYLKEIPGTPFAERVTETVFITNASNIIYHDDVASALNVDNLYVFNTGIKRFIYDSVSGEYTAEYYKSVWLRSMTTGGNYVDYFLDINYSYEDYYAQFVENDVFDSGLYEWFYNTNILAECPELGARTPSQVYGFFGFVAVPQDYELDAIWSEMFSVDTTKTGLIKSFEYGHSITYAAYLELLNDYDYTWIEKAWNTVLGSGVLTPLLTDTYSANYYMFYSSPTESAYIGENGGEDATDNTGAFVKPIKNALTIFNDFGNGVLNWIGGGFSWLTGGGLNIVLIIAIVALCVYIYIKYFRKK